MLNRPVSCLAIALTLSLAAAPLGAADVSVPGQAGGSAATAVSAFKSANPGADFYTAQDGRITTVYGAAFSTGESAAASAAAFKAAHAGLFGARADELLPISRVGDGAFTRPMMWQAQTNSFKFTLASYTQSRAGIPVWRSELRLLTRNEPGFPLVLARSALKDLGEFQPALDKVIEAKTTWAAAALMYPTLTEFTDPSLVIFAGTPDEAAPPVLAWEFLGSGVGFGGVPERVLFLVDAITGQAVYDENLIVHADITGNVSGLATTGNAAGQCLPEASVPLPYARVSVSGGNTAHADVNGNFTIPHAGVTPVTVTSEVRGLHFNVNESGGTDQVLSQSVTPPGPVNFVHNADNLTEQYLSEVNTYVHANKARDYLLQFEPLFPTISPQVDFPINVNIVSTCNAFYDPGAPSINFYLAGGGCANTGFSTVVHHEFGHHIVNAGGSGQGPYGEGFSDVVAVMITDTSPLGVGFQNNCASGIRNANNACFYSAATCTTNCGSAFHDCGRLISGCAWSVRTNLLATNPLDYRDIVSGLAFGSVLLHTGTTITPQITIDFLTLDDNDADILNGTPHYTQINNGFSVHGMPGPVLPPIYFIFPDGRPGLIDPAGDSFPVQVSRVEQSTQPGNPNPNTAMLHYNTGGGFVSISLPETSPNNYNVTFPTIPCPTVVTWYLTAQATTPTTVSIPLTAPAAVFSVVSATGAETPVDDGFEIASGWTVGGAGSGDAATSGIWTRVNPVGTAAQPEDDHTPTPGSICFVTGQGTVGGALGANDVDGGQTSLFSPTYDLAAAVSPKVSYWRWYSNDTGAAPNADTFVVQVSNNNGASWTTLETVGPGGQQASGGWIYAEFNLAPVIPLTSTMKFRFNAADLPEGSLIEAAVDDFRIDSFLCDETNCAVDLDGSTVADVPDIFLFLALWFAQDPAANFDGLGPIDVPDIFAFLAAWFAGCP